MSFAFTIDWELEAKAFDAQIDELISQAKKTDSIISLPLELKAGEDGSKLIVSVSSQIDRDLCIKCGAKCCKAGPAGIALFPSELENIAAKHPLLVTRCKGKTRNGEDGGIELSYPCPFISGNDCQIYDTLPFACIIFPLQFGAHELLGNTEYLGISSECPQSIDIVKRMYKYKYRLTKSLERITGGE